MKSGRFAVVLVTAPDLSTGRKLARAVLKRRLAACVNVLPAIESHYWWEGKIENGREVLLVFKSSAELLNSLERCILQNHPYDTPEFLCLRVDRGNARYLEWLAASLVIRPKQKQPRARIRRSR